jgi:hypothetical protein
VILGDESGSTRASTDDDPSIRNPLQPRPAGLLVPHLAAHRRPHLPRASRSASRSRSSRSPDDRRVAAEELRGRGPTFGWSFLWTSTWDPVFSSSGPAFVYGTLASSPLALLIAVPIGLGAAICLAELLPPKLSRRPHVPDRAAGRPSERRLRPGRRVRARPDQSRRGKPRAARASASSRSDGPVVRRRSPHGRRSCSRS